LTEVKEKGIEVHPFLSYEIAKGMVEEVRAISERRIRWRRTEPDETSPLPSWDAAVIRLTSRDSEGEQEKVGA
jgi:hypothetical protein